MHSISKTLLTTAFSVFVLSACMSGDVDSAAVADDKASTEAAAPVETTTAEAAPAATEEATTESAEAAPAAEAESTAPAESAEGGIAETAPDEEQAAEMPRFIEGQHYTKLNFELPTVAPEGKIEVAELFWYGCPHCNALEPVMKEYDDNTPENVSFRRMPATLAPHWGVHAKAFYVGQALDSDGSKGIHGKIFASIHEQHRRMTDDDAAKRLFVSQGFTEEEFDAAANSMEVQAKVKTAEQYSATSQASGVPTLIINGKYMTSPTMAQGSVKMMKVIKFLVEQEAK